MTGSVTVQAMVEAKARARERVLENWLARQNPQGTADQLKNVFAKQNLDAVRLSCSVREWVLDFPYFLTRSRRFRHTSSSPLLELDQ